MHHYSAELGSGSLPALAESRDGNGKIDQIVYIDYSNVTSITPFCLDMDEFLGSGMFDRHQQRFLARADG